MADVELRKLRKTFGSFEAIRDLDLRIEDREFVVFVGPSGCGKSTLLRLIAGLEDASGGEIRIGGQDVTQKPPKDRGIAMVFQSYALYPHMNVYRNIAFGLSLGRTDRKEIDQRVRRAAEILELSELLERMPRELSGGQRQRVAIGRAIVRDPAVFLFDEPLSNLDATLRVQMRIEIARLHQSMQATMVYVTHDQVEAMTLADRIVVLNEGRIEQVGRPVELYERPRNLFVAGFIGSPRMNFLPARVLEAGPAQARLALPGGADIALPLPEGERVSEGERLTLGVRPEHILGGEEGEASLAGEVAVVEELGDAHLVYLRVEEGGADLVTARFAGPASLREGERAAFGLPARACHLFREDGRALERPSRD